MNKKQIIFRLFAAALIFLQYQNIYSQSVQIELSPNIQFSQVIYISDFGFVISTSTEFLYQLTITGGSVKIVKLQFQALKDGEIIAEAKSDTFTLPTGTHFINNIQLNNGYTFPGGGYVIFDESNVFTPTTDFQNQLLESGKLPRGHYDFQVQLLRENDTPLTDPVGVGLDIINPSYVSAVTPYYNEEVYTEYPIFQFDSDLRDPLALADDPFHVQVFEKPVPPPNLSIDEVMSEENLVYDDWVGAAGNFFQYPTAQAGVRPLQYGHAYVWRVQMRVQTSNGPELIQSPPYIFNLIQPLNGAAGDEVMGDVYQLLRMLIGNRVDQIASNLSNFELKTIRLNGEPISAEQLFSILEGYEGSLIEIKDLVLESTQK